MRGYLVSYQDQQEVRQEAKDQVSQPEHCTDLHIEYRCHTLCLIEK